MTACPNCDSKIPVFTEPFGDGATVSPTSKLEDQGTYTFKVTSSDSGFTNVNSYRMYPLAFSMDGAITFKGSVPSGGSVDVKFKFESLGWEGESETVTINGATEAAYSAAVPSQCDDQGNLMGYDGRHKAINSIKMYVLTTNVEVVIKDFVVDSDIGTYARMHVHTCYARG